MASADELQMLMSKMRRANASASLWPRTESLGEGVTLVDDLRI